MSKPQVMDERTGQNKEFDLVRWSEILIRILSGTVRGPNFSPRYTGLGSTGLGVRYSDGSLKFGPIRDRRHHGPKKFLPSFWTIRRTEKARTAGKSSNRTNYGPNES